MYILMASRLMAKRAGALLRSGHSTLIAEVYDLDKPIGARYKDVDYYLQVLAEIRGPILELACGTGRFLVPLREMGCEIDGLDHSPEMLAVCRRHCDERGLDPVLYEADMAPFEVEKVYDVIVIASGAIKELDGREGALQALECCREALAPGGRLIVDLVPPRLVSEPGPMRHWRRDRYLWTLHTVQLDYDASANRTTEFIRYEKWRDGSLLAAEMHQFCMQHWNLQEFDQLLLEAGFTDVRVLADYEDGKLPGPADEDWTFHATRT